MNLITYTLVSLTPLIITRQIHKRHIAIPHDPLAIPPRLPAQRLLAILFVDLDFLKVADCTGPRDEQLLLPRWIGGWAGTSGGERALRSGWRWRVGGEEGGKGGEVVVGVEVDFDMF